MSDLYMSDIHEKR